MNTFAEDWKKGPIGYGLFAENSERKDGNFLKKCAAGRPAALAAQGPPNQTRRRMEEKKLLSFIESSGLLSAAEKAGVTLSKVEELKLLSTAERLGLLSLAESAGSTDGALISSLGLPFFVLGCASLLCIPDQSLVLTVVQDVLALTLFGGSAALLVTGNLVAALNE